MNYRQVSGTKGELKFYGDVSEWWISGDDYDRTITEMMSKFQEIDIRMHCYGGSVFEGEVIVNTNLRYYGKIKIIVDGVAASMASIILMSVAEVEMADNAYIMIHAPSGYTQGGAKAHFLTGGLLTKMEKSFAKRFAARTGKPEKDVQQWFDGNDYWYSAEEAKELGLATKILPAIATATANLAKPDKGQGVETLFSKYVALLNTHNPKNQITDFKTMKKDLIAKFNLTGVTENSTDAEIIAALEKQAGSDKESLQTQAKTALTTLIAFAGGLRDTPFSEAQVASFTAIGEKVGIEALRDVLGLVPSAVATAPAATAATTTIQQAPVARVVNMLTVDAKTNPDGSTPVAADRKDWNWNKWQEQDDEGLEELRTSNPAAFKALYKAEYKVDPIL